MPEKELYLRYYQDGDEQEILTLFELAFHRKMSHEFWKWRYQDNPSGKGIIRLAFDGDLLVGHFGFLPMRVQYGSETLRAIFPITSMTHPDYWGRGIFTSLMAGTYEYAAAKGYQLAYGFPNENSVYACRRYGYRDIVSIGILEKQLDKEPDDTVSENIKKVNIFDDKFDRLWQLVSNNYEIITVRNAEQLNWRFSSYSEICYHTFAYHSGLNEIDGYIVLKIFQDGRNARGHIIDLLTIPDEHIAAQLINHACNYFRQRGVNNVSCWFPEKSFYDNILTSAGFVRRQEKTNFAVMLLNKNDTVHAALEEPARWHFTMGDSDVF